MNHRFWLFKRNDVYYVQDALTRKKESLKTSERKEAERLRAAKNEAYAQPMLNLALGRTYLSAQDPALSNRTWAQAIEKLCGIGRDSTKIRKRRELERDVYNVIREKKIIETRDADFYEVLASGSTSTTHYLRCLHNLARGLGWLPWEVIPAKFWPVKEPGEKKAITSLQHQSIVEAERNEERQAFYSLLWETGASQSDAAGLTADHIDWKDRILSYQRRKTGQWCHLTMGKEIERVLRQLPSVGPLFPHIATLSANDRSAEFYRRCKLLKIEGISLHSYRYAWAERARKQGIRTLCTGRARAQQQGCALRAYARNAQVILPPLEEYERKPAREKVLRLPSVEKTEKESTGLGDAHA